MYITRAQLKSIVKLMYNLARLGQNETQITDFIWKTLGN